MSYSLEVFPDLPVLLFRAHRDYNQEKEMPLASQRVIAILDRVENPTFVVLDMTEQAFELDQLMAAAEIAQGESAAFHHPNVWQVIIVTHNPAVKMRGDRLKPHIYGKPFVSVYETCEDALAYVRSRL